MSRPESATILDVIDNYSTSTRAADVSALPGKNLKEFGEEVRRYTQSSPEVALDAERHPVYLGGWPSANFGSVAGQMLLSSLLYSGQVVIKDPLADWFSEEQYLVEHKMSARTGHRRVDGSLDIRSTRRFLRFALPLLKSMRPLIEAGIVVLVPSESVFKREEDTISQLRQTLTDQFATSPTQYLRQFTPSDIPIDDNRRGMFTWIGGRDKEEQYRYAISSGMLYFAREYTLSRSVGATYTAPFRHERFVASEGLGPAISSPSNHVTEAILQSRLPVFQGLTPQTIAQIHEDDAFAAFRAELHTVYQSLPSDVASPAFEAHLRDQEEALLRPRIEAAERAVDAGRLGQLQKGIPGTFFSIAAGVLVDLASGTPGLGIAAGAGVAVAQGLAKGMQQHNHGSQVIWNALVRHNRRISQEINGVEARPRTTPATDPWSIPDKASNAITISGGAMLYDGPPLPAVNSGTHGYNEGVYRPCECGSGEKFKFCCYGV